LSGGAGGRRRHDIGASRRPRRAGRLAVTRPGSGRVGPARPCGLPARCIRTVWLRHAIVPGTPLCACVEFSQHGQIKMLGWRPFTAAQVLAAFQGYIWTERTSLFGLPVHGFDRLSAGDGEMRHCVLRQILVVAVAGPDFIRSAAARLCCEIAFVPAAALDPAVSWRAVADNSVTGRIRYLDRSYDVTLTVAASGALQRVTVPRWTKLGNGRTRNTSSPPSSAARTPSTATPSPHRREPGTATAPPVGAGLPSSSK
jgi:hypothetical protein